MHIPDSLLSPTTSLACNVAMLPVWWGAARRVRNELQSRQVPLLALGAAFCFTIMLFNLPALGGTTAHPVAGTLLAILLGPWAACIGVSVALGIQALFFADGGLWAFGANCFPMAFAMPFLGYALYRALKRLQPDARWTPLWAALAAYLGLNVAAAIVALLLGIQPILFHDPSGQPLYFPFGLKITLPAMLSTHLIVAGPAEAIVTALVVRFLQASRIPLYDDQSVPSGRSRYEPLWIGLLAMLALSPLGLLASGDAWGEWDTEGLKAEIQRVEGKSYLPQGVAQADANGYAGLPGLGDYASEKGAKGYLLAGGLGIGVIALLLLVGGRLLTRSERSSGGSDGSGGSSHKTEERVSPPSQAVSLPEWLQRPSEAADTPPKGPERPTNRFVERTLAELATGATTTLHSERWAQPPGYLQNLDARAKLLTLTGLIILSGWVRHPVSLVLLYGLTLLLAGMSRLPLGMFTRRVWLSVALFGGAIALPTALNLATPGKAVLTLWTSPLLTLTQPGLSLAGTLLLRLAVVVSLASLLTLTTPWNRLLQALRAGGVPRLFVAVLMMTYRYLLVLMQSAAELFTARRSRTVGAVSNAAGRGFMGQAIGSLFSKTLALSEEVHAAMTARGFTGEVRTLTAPQWRLADTYWTLSIALIALLTLFQG